jgi:superfamily II DNA or RNA helicase
MQTNVIIKIIDESNVLLITKDDSIHNFLYKKYSLYVKGFMHSKLYKLGRWDGKINFYSANGKTYLNLLPEILEYFLENKITFNILDSRPKIRFKEFTMPENFLPNVKLAPHQINACNAVINFNGGIILAATGSGKTYITAALSKYYNDSYGFRVIMIVPTKDLIQQSYAQFIKSGLDPAKVGIFYADKKEVNAEILISTWQSLQHFPELIGQFKAIIVDECHGATGAVLKNLLVKEASLSPVKIGVTGTLPKDPVDFMSVRISLGDVKYNIEPSELIEMGWLANLKINLLILKENFHDDYQQFLKTMPPNLKKLTYNQFLLKLFPDYFVEKKYLMGNKERLTYIADAIKDIMKLKKLNNSLILVNNISTGKELEKMIENSIFVKREKDLVERKEIYSSFENNNDICIIATYKLISTGLDVPRIFNLFLLDVGESFIKVIQSIGRGLRKGEDKDYLKVFDITSNLKYSKSHMATRKKYYAGKKYPYSEIELDYRE